MFSVSADGIVTALDSAAHLSPQRLIEKYAAVTDLTWAGPGAHLQRRLLEDSAPQFGIPFVEEDPDLPRHTHEQRSKVWRLAAKETNLAQHVAALALQLFESGELQSPQSLQAIYVRPSDAELNQQCR